MAPKKRNKENRAYPKGWRWRLGAFRYRVPAGMEHLWDNKKEFTLGTTEAEAYRVWAERLKTYERGGLQYMEQAIEKYEIEVLPGKAAATQKSNRYSLQRLRQAFAGTKISLVRPVHIYQYREYIATSLSEKHYNLDHEVLSHVFTKCIEWGARDDHPMTNKKVVKYSTKQRTRYVEDWELAAFMSVCPTFLVAYLNLKMLLGQDKGDLLSIKRADISDDGLTLAPRKKTKAKRQETRSRFFPYYIERDGELINTGLEQAVEDIQALPRKVKSLWLFATRSGQPYIKEDGTTSGFDSIWQRAMAKALEETELTERFTEHDLRAKVGSDAATDEDAQRQLDHANVHTTRKVYRRKAVVMPVAKGIKSPSK